MIENDTDVLLDAYDKKILNFIQRQFPLVEKPFLAIGKKVGLGERETIERIQRMHKDGVIRRIRALYDAASLGYISTLVACRVDRNQVDAVAAHCNTLVEISHNYLRNHEYNLWFTLIARDKQRQTRLLDEIRAQPGVRELYLMPALKTYKLKVNFQLEDDDA